MTLDWLIVGGGIHGVHIAVCLLHHGHVDPDRLGIVDPAPRLLSRWRTRAKATGMAYLRSPVMHHLDAAPYALLSFAAQRSEPSAEPFIPPNDRPSLELFHAHCEHVIDRLNLGERHVRGRVDGIAVDADGARVTLDGGRDLEARRVVLAIGSGERVAWPDWAPRDHPRIQHVFDPERDGCEPVGPSVAVLGGGISAAQVALRLVRAGHRVDLISRHALRTRQYDSDAGWHGPKYMVDYASIEDPARRRERIGEGRNRGSMPPDVREALEDAIVSGEVTLHEAGVEALVDDGEPLRLRLDDGSVLTAHDLVLAIGFARGRPGGPMLDQLVASASLPCAPCGFPLVDAALRWHPSVHVVGPLAEIELGPIAGNISGARRAGERILASLEGPDALLEDPAPPKDVRAAPASRLSPTPTEGPRMVPWGNRRWSD